mmetsp:Transcript_25157/g.73814  ORF Transcript_25157/g.73814 Transcript_25157/m.73814 type:complete len:207 (-) Transcript_25157:574-1194(-)
MWISASKVRRNNLRRGTIPGMITPIRNREGREQIGRTVYQTGRTKATPMRKSLRVAASTAAMGKARPMAGSEAGADRSSKEAPLTPTVRENAAAMERRTVLLAQIVTTRTSIATTVITAGSSTTGSLGSPTSRRRNWTRSRLMLCGKWSTSSLSMSSAVTSGCGLIWTSRDMSPPQSFSIFLLWWHTAFPTKIFLWLLPPCPKRLR